MCLTVLKIVTSQRAELAPQSSFLRSQPEGSDMGNRNSANNTLHFVNVLKDSLRKNNDDYANEQVAIDQGFPDEVTTKFIQGPAVTPEYQPLAY